MKTSSTVKDKKNTAKHNHSFARNTAVSNKSILEQNNSIRNILSSSIQTKLSVGKPGDHYEREADAVADKVASGEQAPLISRINNKPPTEKLTQRQSTSEEDDEEIQTKAKDKEEEEEKVQTKSKTKKEEEEEKVQTKPKIKKEEEEEKVQKKETSSGSITNSKSAAATHAVQNKGSGNLLNPSTLQTLESGIGSDFSHVRVHEDANAKQASKALNARAFTYKNDIWLGEGESQNDTKLMAHEATHVVQQTGLVQGFIQRNTTTSSVGTATTITTDNSNDETSTVTNTEAAYDGPEGTTSTSNQKIIIKEIHFPAVPEKEIKTGSRNVEIRKGNVERDTQQIQKWSEYTRNGNGLSDALDDKTGSAWKSGSNSNPTYFLKIGTRGGSYIVGTRTAIRDRVIRPYWTSEGRIKTYDVDHKKEYQLGGHDLEENLWLLDSKTNRSSGSRINSKINQSLDRLLAAWNSSGKPSTEDARDNYTVVLETIHWDGPVEGDGANYSISDISETASQMQPIRAMSRRSVQRAGLDPGEGRFIVFNNSTGGRARTISLPSSSDDSIPFTDANFITGFRPSEARFVGDNDNYIEINGVLWADNSAIKGHGFPASFTISRMSNLPQAGYLNVRRAENKIRQIFSGEIEASALSPLQLTSVGMDELGAPLVEGTVSTNISFLEGASIDFFIRGNNLGIEKTFSSEELNTPSPFEIEEASLTVSLSTQEGLAAEGNVGFKIEGVGKGNVTASVGTSQEFGLSGNFNFDERLFGQGTTAQVRMAYENGEWSVGGTLTIPEDKVPGIKTATINVDYSEANGFSAQGDAQLNVPGVESGSLAVTHTEEDGFTIGGEFALSSDIPGIQGGSISAEVREREDGEGYSISARGEAQPAIPGIDSSIRVTYDDGAFSIEGEAAYERGIVSGSVLIGATNRIVDSDGNPTEEIGRNVTAYGGGSVTVQIAPWLQGTVGIKLLPNGEMEITGEISLPDVLEIFPEKKLEKNIFSINLDIPIIGFAVAGQRVGIFATIGGGLDLSAGVGPGQLQDLGLAITYNPDHEDQTHVTGGAKLVIPAHAGLRLFIRGALGAGIPIISAQLGLEIGGQLGLEGAAEAGVQVDWTPQTGLVLDALGEIYVEPKFRFDLTGFALVEADLLVTTIELYSKRWELAAFELGPDLRLGVRFPIHYEENKPFEISWDNVEFDVPDVDTGELMDDLVEQII